MKKQTYYSVFIFLLYLCHNSFSQNAMGKLRGYIYDAYGFPLMGATAILEGTEKGATTNIDGLFIIENIVPNTYNVTARYVGFEATTAFNIIVKSVGNQPFTFTLKESSNTLNEVLIKNSQVSKPKETPVSFQKLSAVEIATYPGGNNDIVKVAQSLPGISPSPGGFRNDLIIRGGGANETVYYLDGVEIPNINHFSTQGSAGGPVGLLNVSFMENVNLSSSSFGAQYENPLSGVLQFNQRFGNRNTFAGNVRVSASETALTLEGPLFKSDAKESNTSYLISVRRSYLEFLFKLIGLPIRPNYWDYQYKVTHQLGKNDELHLIGLGSVDDFSVEVPANFDQEQQATLEQAPFIEQKTNTIGLSWKHRFQHSANFIRTVLSNNRLQNTFTRFGGNENEKDPFFVNDAVEQETKLRFAYHSFFKGFTLKTGFNAQISNYQNTTFDERNALHYNSNIHFFKYGAFANLTKSFIANTLDVSMGFRVDADTFTRTRFLDTFSPRIAVSYEFIDTWKMSASVGRYFKIAPYTILGFKNQQGALVNQYSNYTRSDHYVLGLSKAFSKSVSLSLEGFYKNYDDYPVSIRDGVSLANKGAGFEVLGNEPIAMVGKGRAYGLEFLFQQKLTRNFYGILSYTLFYSEFTGLNSNKYLPSVWDSRHLISFTGGYKLPRNWELSSRWRFAGKTPFVPVNVEASTPVYPDILLDYDRLGEEKLNVFSQADVRIDKKWNFSKLSLNLFLEIQNVLFQDIPKAPKFGLYRDANGMVTSPRTLQKIQASNNAPIPVIGIVIDF
ncbi:TonB-dependent receptor [Tenacibaculum maritimum]|uniref:TonB-dependent receptor n=1 Tax=Tenacibaculum maritimum TaxID=107401 RepID=UPI00132F634D|nr:TonB-dependent receptor [Tenacibaculum maritimum]